MSSIEDNTRSLKRGVSESIYHMSGRVPKPASKLWFWVAIGTYSALLGLLGMALWVGVQAGA